MLTDIIQGSPVPTFVIDQDHRVVHWNRACEVILGYPADRMIGTRDQWRAFYPTERPVMADLVVSGELDRLVGRYYEGKFRRSTLVPGSFEAEDFFPGIGQSGTWLYFTAAPVHDADGRVIGAIETLQDVSARKLAELAEKDARASLQVSHDRLRTIIEHFPCGVSVIDNNFDLIESNAEFRSLLDFPAALFSPERTPLERIFRFNAERGEYGDGDVDAQVRSLMERSSRLEAHSFERTRPDGTILEIRGTPLPGGGLITSYNDVTERRRIEQRLEELLTEHQVIFKNVQVGIAWLKERRVVKCNPKLAEIFGFASAEEVIGQPTRRFYPSDEAWKRDGQVGYSRLAELGSIEGESTAYCRIDGTPLCLFRTGSLLDVRNPHSGSIWTFTDITEYKRQEDELRLSGVVFDNASEAFVVTDREVNIITVNRAFEQLTGYARAEVLGRNPRILSSSMHGEDFYRAMWQSLKTEGRWSGEVWDRCKDGTVIPLSLAIAVVKDSSGEVCNYISTFSDISARKRAEQAQQRAIRDLQAVLDAAHEVSIIATDLNGRITLFNRGAERMLGYRAAEMSGLESPLKIHLQEEVEARRAELMTAYDGSISIFDTFTLVARREGSETRDWTFRRKNGSTFQVSMVVTSVTDAEGNVTGFLEIARDISEQRQAEAALRQLNADLEGRVSRRTIELQCALNTVKKTQEELARSDRMAALGQLVAGVSHELNTPIGNCVTVASTLLDETDAFFQSYQGGALRRSQFEDFLERSKTAAQLLLRGMQKAQRLVSEFKQVASDQSGEQRRSFDLAEVVGSLVSLLSPTLRKHGVTIALDIPAGIVLDSYPGLVEQVVNNLFNNALLHAFDRHADPCIHLSATMEGAIVHLAVSDNGAGIPAESIGRVFDPFYTTKLGQGGTGLGLNIVYNIVTGALGGEVKVSSTPGQGALFTVSIPLRSPLRTSPLAASIHSETE